MKRLRPFLSARTVEDVWEHHTALMRGFGFDRMFYAYTCFQAGNRFSDPDDALILTNHHPDYIDAYIGRGLYRDAPMMNWAAQNVGAISWRQINAQGTCSPRARAVLDLNRRFGIVAGYTISFPIAIKRAAAGIGLAARAGLTQDDVDTIWTLHGTEIETMNHVAHLVITQLPATGQSRVLTKRQSEVLELVADGKSVQDIALLLGRTPATVDKHLRGARDSLRVETTAQAVRKASVLNQIFVLEPGDVAGQRSDAP